MATNEEQVEMMVEQAAAERWTGLDLSGRQLYGLPPHVGNLTSLERFNLSNNNFVEISRPLFEPLQSLSHLLLNYNHMTRLSSVVGDLGNLVELNLNHNELTTLPPAIGNCVYLKELYVRNNKLTDLPEELGNCMMLEALNIGANYLEDLPRSLANLTALTRFKFDDNPFSNIPANVVQTQKGDAMIAWLSGAEVPQVLPPGGRPRGPSEAPAPTPRGKSAPAFNVRVSNEINKPSIPSRPPPPGKSSPGASPGALPPTPGQRGGGGLPAKPAPPAAKVGGGAPRGSPASPGRGGGGAASPAAAPSPPLPRGPPPAINARGTAAEPAQPSPRPSLPPPRGGGSPGDRGAPGRGSPNGGGPPERSSTGPLPRGGGGGGPPPGRGAGVPNARGGGGAPTPPPPRVSRANTDSSDEVELLKQQLAALQNKLSEEEQLRKRVEEERQVEAERLRLAEAALKAEEDAGVAANYQEINVADITWGRELGAGAFGAVMSGSWHGCQVAIKKLFGNADPVEFHSEVSVLARLRHPNIILFMGACTRPPNMCIVTEFCGRGSLYDLLQDPSKVLTEKQIHKAIMDTVRGMCYLHSCMIMHRDLKTQNLLVDDNWTVKVADFGLAKFHDPSMGSVKSTVGTYNYMAPEVMNGHSYTTQADVYSFGICLWEFYARKIPFGGMEPAQIIHAVDKGGRPGVVPQNMHPVLQRLTKECWQTSAAKRPLFDDVLYVLENEVPVPR